ncbi:cyclin D1/2/4 [Aureococcus anophagefferens]|uniref:Cyclin D1/2/4 n=1 Tax=Aureococcus anophagefferens TaxID=44056 RepID=A0ABR1FJA2_AURAN
MKRLHALSSSEALYAPRSDYIDAVQVDGMKEAWRTKIMAWFDQARGPRVAQRGVSRGRPARAQLGESFKLKPETLSFATNYLDRYLSRRLASIASIFLASKIEETRPFRTSDFVTLSDGLFSGSDLRLMELELLAARSSGT